MPISPSDLFLSADLSEEEACRYLAARGLRDPAAADRRLQGLAADLATREAMAGLAGLLLDALGEVPDPDLAVEVFAHYAASRVPRPAFLRYLADDPRALGVLVGVAGASPWLGALLVRHPERFHWLVREVDRSAPDALDLAADADDLLATAGGPRDGAERLSHFRDRELLRIGARDLVGRDTPELVADQLSDLADVIVSRAYGMAAQAALAAAGVDTLPGRVAVLALGRFGGREMDYGAELPIICLIEPDREEDRAARATLQSVGQHLAALVGDPSALSRAYRVRPGLGARSAAGGTTPSFRQWARDLAETIPLDDRLALVKARRVAGDADLASRAMELIEPLVFGPATTFGPPTDVGSSLFAACREASERIELFAARLHAANNRRHPEGRRRDTLESLAAPELLDERRADALAGSYRFLRAVEHRWQLVESPDGPEGEGVGAAAACARLLGLSGERDLEAEVARHCALVREVCQSAAAHHL